MEYVLRPYQLSAVEAGVQSLLYSKDNNLIMAPSGSGKSLIIAEICHRLNEPVLILQPSLEILNQNKAKLVDYGITDIGVYSASAGEKTIGKYTLATIGSIRKKPELFKHFKFTIFDEVHLFNAKNTTMYSKFFKQTGTKVLGLTATPFRLEQRFLKKTGGWMEYTGYILMLNRIKPFFFKKMVYKTSHQELLDQGYLCPIEYRYKDGLFDTHALKLTSNKSNYTDKSVELYMNLPTNISKVVSAVSETLEETTRVLVFCPSISNSENVRDALESVYNIKAEVLTGECPKRERMELLERFKTGETKVVLNVGTMTTGYDLPKLDGIVLARPTFSLGLYYQMVCRGVRNAPGKKKCIVVDCCKNVKRMGRIETLKIGKELDGFRDRVETEIGVMSNIPCFKWSFQSHDFKKKKQDKLL